MVHFITDILLSNHKVLGLSAKNFLILKNLNNLILQKNLILSTVVGNYINTNEDDFRI